jgi:hypothetical protein
MRAEGSRSSTSFFALNKKAGDLFTGFEMSAAFGLLPKPWANRPRSQGGASGPF